MPGNLIGTDPTGLLDRGNGGFGICDGCAGGFRNTIGGSTAGAGNVISSNTAGGYVTGTFDSVVQGNTIGLDGDVEFTVTVTTVFVTGASITATATNPGGSTSEFSACLEAVSTQIPIFSDGFESGDTTEWSSTVPNLALRANF